MRMEKFTAVVLAVCLLLSVGVLAFATEPAPHWAQNAIDRFSEFDAALSDPDGALTLGEAAELFSELLGLENPEGNAIFACGRAGILDSLTAQGGDAASPVSREAFFVMLYRALRLSQVPEGSTGFQDEDEISSWAMDAVRAINARGWLAGTDPEVLSPAADMTRGGALSLLDRAVEQWVTADSALVEARGGVIVVSARDVLLNGSADAVVIAGGAKDSALTMEDFTVNDNVTVTAGSALLLMGNTDIPLLTVEKSAPATQIYVGESVYLGETRLEAEDVLVVGSDGNGPPAPELPESASQEEGLSTEEGEAPAEEESAALSEETDSAEAQEDAEAAAENQEETPETNDTAEIQDAAEAGDFTEAAGDSAVAAVPPEAMLIPVSPQTAEGTEEAAETEPPEEEPAADEGTEEPDAEPAQEETVAVQTSQPSPAQAAEESENDVPDTVPAPAEPVGHPEPDASAVPPEEGQAAPAAGNEAAPVPVSELPGADYSPVDAVGPGNLIDYDGGALAYTGYELYALPAEEGANYDVLVEISMTGLKPHQSRGAGIGWWTGFSVQGPAGATSVQAEYSHDGRTYGKPVAARLSDGRYAHYFDAARWGTYYVRLTWSGAAQDSAFQVTYKLDFSGVEMAVASLTTPESKIGKIGTARLSDDTSGAAHKDRLYSDYSVSVEGKKDANGGYLEVTVHATELQSFRTAAGIGNWAGFSVSAPYGAESYKYSAYVNAAAARNGFASKSPVPRERFSADVDGEGSLGIVQRSDASKSNQRSYWAVLQWFSDPEGTEPLTAPEVFHIVIDATLA